MAKDNLFFSQLAKLSKNSQAPIISVIIQGFIAVVLALSGTFDQLTDYVVFSSWLFYALCGFSVIIFRKKLPNQIRSYKVWGYPFLPIVFVVCASLLLLNTLVTSPTESIIGLVIILLGWPVYQFYFVKKQI